MELAEYEPSIAGDYALLAWLEEMRRDGELHQTLLTDGTPSTFLNFFSRPTIYLVGAEENGTLWFTAWVEPTLDGRVAWFSSWCRPSVRGTPKHVRATGAAYSAFFEHYHTLLGMTKQRKLLDLHRKIGYIRMGEVVDGWDDSTVYYLKLTRSNFEQGTIAHYCRRH